MEGGRGGGSQSSFSLPVLHSTASSFRNSVSLWVAVATDRCQFTFSVHPPPPPYCDKMVLRQLWHTVKTGSRRRRFSSSYGGSASLGRYAAELEASLTRPEDYWAAVAENTIWMRRWERVVDNPDSPFAKWFPGGELSLCYNAVDRHVDGGYGDQTAVIWDSPITGRWAEPILI